MSDTSPLTERPMARLGAILFSLEMCLILILALVGRFHGFKIYDDAYMFVRYADHILAGEGMVWNIGEGPAYGATSLAYVFAVIPFRLLFPGNASAAIFCTSFFWGLVFMVLLVRLALNGMGANANQRQYLLGFVLLSLLGSAASLRVHFASGMETTLVMAYLVLCIGALEAFRRGKGSVLWTGIGLGVAWWVRPDLILFTVGVPALVAMLNRDAEQRGRWWKVVLISLTGLAVCLVSAKFVAGSWLPLSFVAKSTGLYGAEFASIYKTKSYWEGMRFLAAAWPAVIVIVLGLYVRWGHWRESYTLLDGAVLFVSMAFACYYLFFVLQVMGQGQRFYFPLLPWLVYLGMRELVELNESLRVGHGLQFKQMPRGLRRAGMAFMAVLLLYYGVDYGLDLRRNPYLDRIAVFDARQTYLSDLNDYWPRLADLPPGVSIATTEVGMPAALYPDHVIHDLAGLNSPGLIAAGLDVDAVLKVAAADLIFLPHPHYARMANSIARSEAFQEAYVSIPAAGLNADMGVAIRKEGPYSSALLERYRLQR